MSQGQTEVKARCPKFRPGGIFSALSETAAAVAIDTLRAANADGKSYEWAAMGRGIIDWVGQFRALARDGYHFAVSLETHWHGGGTPEASTRESWAGMKDELQKAAAL